MVPAAVGQSGPSEEGCLGEGQGLQQKGCQARGGWCHQAEASRLSWSCLLDKGGRGSTAGALPHGAGRWLCSRSFLGVRQGAAGSGFLVEWALLPLQACSFLCSPSPCLSADVSWSRS